MKQHLSSVILLVSVLFSQGAEPYTVHEWGTFTSLQLSDGKQMSWLSSPTEDLPGFIYKDINHLSTLKKTHSSYVFAKSSTRAKLRMETPVIYFHSDEARMVNVQVDLPKGRLTEWYPVAAAAGPALTGTNFYIGSYGFGTITNPKYIKWDKIQIHAPNHGATLIKDDRGSHYYDARNTTANLLSVPSHKGTETEGFLFYRGVAHFDSPVKVTENSKGMLLMQNSLNVAINNALLIETDDKQIKRRWLGNFLPNGTITVKKPNEQKELRVVTVSELSKEFVDRLAAAGLNRDEAAAMVSTWDDSWFEEKGTRVLYFLPQSWVDERMPLKMSPTPSETKRVMVARSELIRKDREFALLQAIMLYSRNTPEARAQALNDYRELALGRFANEVVAHLTRTVKYPAFKAAARDLIQNTNVVKQSKTKTVASNLTFPSPNPAPRL